ncbi:DNA-binding protein [Exidia glandulosa HHB12029]|uniref:DNA-binding protein n=1 Tax=Exidia glandulosa HHB12029 TaxID=1314781 RepID=A0A165KDQ2_EXIGL|nr:DNA-binding protein [Exidia glandulosa HHB12029]
MQAQAVRHQTQTPCSAATSTRFIRSVVYSSIASILFSRGLLPEDCFTHTKMSGEGGNESQSRSFPLRGLRTSYSSEVDRIHEAMTGAFEALERRYLRKLVFAIYLDESDPTNIIESYTFDISYDRNEGSGERNPILSISDQLQKVNLGKVVSDPTVKTMSDLKRAVKNLVNHLVLTMDMGHLLPHSCYVGFQLYYTDDTPDEYEPPSFSAGDAEANKYRLKTHNEAERPDTHSLRPFRTGYHSIGIHTASIAAFIPDRLQVTAPTDEDRILQQERDINLQDAQTRTTDWDLDAIIKEEATVLETSGSATPAVSERRASEMDVDVEYGGKHTPRQRIGSLLRGSRMAVDDTFTATQVVATQPLEFEETQVVEDTPAAPGRRATRNNPDTIDTMALTDLLLERSAPGSFDLNTQDLIGSPKRRPSQDFEHVGCYCSLTETEDGVIPCDGPCGGYFHVWCFRFHTNDPRLDGEIKCFNCRIAEDPNGVLITRPDVLANARLEFTDLVLFRRALQVVKLYRPGNWTAFKKCMQSVGNTAKPAWARLEREGFIALEDTEVDNTGNAQKAATKKQKKHSTKKKHAPTTKISGAEFERYFSVTVDLKLLDLEILPPIQHSNMDEVTLSGLLSRPLSGNDANPEESQTQDESQFAIPNPPSTLTPTRRKRQHASSASSFANKRVKMSHINTGIGLYNL